MDKNDKKVNFWTKQELYDEFQKACKNDRRSVASVLNILMEEYIKKQK